MRYKDLKRQAAGRWVSILRQLGVPDRLLNKRNQPCPVCGGKDRFRFTNHRESGAYFCSQCGPGGGLDLLMLYHGWSLREAREAVESILGIAKHDVTRAITYHKRVGMLNDLWRQSSPIRPTDPAGLYLARRCGLTQFPPVLRANPDLAYTDDRPSRHPGMVAMVQSVDGSCQTLHRTFLTRDGHKADVPSPRRIMPGAFEAGAAVQLMAPDLVLGVAEGIETAYAAHDLFGVPVWAALNAHNLSQFIVPDGVEELMIFGDADPKYAGQAAAYRLAQRWAVKGMRVSVHIPEIIGTDWLDVWAEERDMRRDDS